MTSKSWKQIVHIAGFFCLCVWGCSSNDLPEPLCSNSNLAIQAVGTNPPDCESTGSIQITATGGSESYTYAVDNDIFVQGATFLNLTPGLHIAKVKDGGGCISMEEVDLDVESSTLDIESIEIEASGCKENNGAFTVHVTGGVGPFTYSQDNLDYSNTTGTFADLTAGTYQVFIKDDDGCIDSKSNIIITSGVSYDNQIFPILDVNCIKSGCHNGDNGAQRNWNDFTNVQNKAQRIKEFTADGRMPADIAPTGLPQFERDLIACWVDDGAKDN
jgi:hypothetical protein